MTHDHTDRKRICVVTAGHLSTCPRMLKAADALAEAGYEVRVVSARYTDWAWQADQDVRRTRSWKWTLVNYDRRQGTTKYFRSGVRFRSAKFLAKFAGPSRCPIGLAANAYSRAHAELLQAILSEPQDLIYGGTSGALACVTAAAKRTGIPAALDLEDLYSDRSAPGRLEDALAELIESTVLPRAAFLTAGSAAIGEAYRRKYGVCAVPLHNTFPLPNAAPDLTPSQGQGLRLYWFGQTIGEGRGIETVVHAMGRARIPGEIHFRGRAVPRYVESLNLLAAAVAPRLKVMVHEPAPPEMMVALCKPYDIGLATEPGSEGNNAILLSNKALTYPLAGLPVAITDTPGQHAFAMDLAEGAILFKPGDVDALAAGLKRWADDKCLLVRAKAAAWDAAKRRWHWEHPLERGALLRAVAAVFQQ